MNALYRCQYARKRAWRACAYVVTSYVFRCRSSHSRMISKRIARWAGLPERESSWDSAGKRTSSTSRFIAQRREQLLPWPIGPPEVVLGMQDQERGRDVFA